MADKKKNRLLSAYYIGGSVTGMNDTDIRRRMDDLEARMDAAEDDIANINTSITTISNQIAAIEARLTSITTISNQIAAIEARLTKIEYEYLKVRDQS